MGNFSNQVAGFTREYERRLRATARTAVQETVSKAQVTIGEGGRMHILTGFLRASIQAALNEMPSGPTSPADKKTKNQYSVGAQVTGEPVSVTLLRWDLNKGTPFFVGWTANYARYRESQDGFLRGAVELWDETVANAARQVRSGLG
jgi:hypothetical protein